MGALSGRPDRLGHRFEGIPGRLPRQVIRDRMPGSLTAAIVVLRGMVMLPGAWYGTRGEERLRSMLGMVNNENGTKTKFQCSEPSLT